MTDDFVYLLWERDNTPYERYNNLLQIFYNKDKADERCRKLNDESNQNYQQELKWLKDKGLDTPLRGNYPKYGYYVNEWRVS